MSLRTISIVCFVLSVKLIQRVLGALIDFSPGATVGGGEYSCSLIAAEYTMPVTL